MVLALAFAALALLLLGGGVLLWHNASQHAQRAQSEHFIGRQIDERMSASLSSLGRASSRLPAWRAGPASWGSLLLRAGVQPSNRLYGVLAGLPLLLCLVAGVLLGPVAAGSVLVLGLAFGFFRLWLKASKRHRKAVEQLPDFLDAVVRMMIVGNSLTAAFQKAPERIDSPLREMVEHANRAQRAGQQLDAALRQAARLYGLHELHLVAAVVSVALRFGGRSDQMLQRMAGFMRDLTQARRELIALSAEVRLSAWVLGLLPLALAGFIMLFNNDLLIGMWHDPVGRKMLAGAVLLQIGGSYWLYRLARLA